MPELVSCKRHPSVETRLRCAVCGDPICPRCAVQTPVGQKCPSDARQPKSARALGTPKQVVRAVAVAVVLAGVGGFVAGLVVSVTRGFLTILLGWFAGMGMGDAVKRAAEGNGASRFRTIAMVGAGALVAVMWLVSIGTALPGGLGILAYAAAVYAAGQRFPWS